METASVPLGKAMYVASALDESWLQNVQRKLFQQSQKQPEYVFAKLWGSLQTHTTCESPSHASLPIVVGAPQA